MPTPAVTPSAAAKEFANRMIHEYGKFCGRRVVIPLTQAALARHYGVAPSTLNWYLRELGPAVVQRRPDLVLSADGLDGLDPSILANPLTPHAPTTAPLGSAGLSTAQARIAAAAFAGDDSHNGTTDPRPNDGAATASRTDTRGAGATAVVGPMAGTGQVAIIGLVVELLDVVSRILQATIQPDPTGATMQREASADPRQEPAIPRTGSADSRVLSADLSREVQFLSPVSEKDLLTDLNSTSSTPRTEPAEIRESATGIRESAATTRGTAERLTDSTTIDELIAPLEELVRRQRLVPVGNRGRLHAALGRHSAEAIAGAVHRIAAQVRTSTDIHSPFGVLIHHAEADQSGFFTPVPTAVHHTPTLTFGVAPTGSLARHAQHTRDEASSPGAAARHCDATGDPATVEVDAIIADPARLHELAELDALIDQRHTSNTPSFTDQLLRIGPLRHALRVDAYRTLHNLNGAAA